MIQQGYSSAVEDFRRARRRASLQRIMARLAGRSDDLLSYDDARRKLRGLQGATQHLDEIPLDAIVGTAGRYSDFTRGFLPLRGSDAPRWARVKTRMLDQEGLPPIEVYRIGDAYFVQDGHHRVSVARQLGATHIEAYVTDVRTKVPLSPDVQPGDLTIKAEYASFLNDTNLDRLRPDADLSVSAPGQYQVLKEHIDVHRYFMGLDRKCDIPYDLAVTHWYDEVYLPVVQAIREQGILRDFPGRTETDLYLWMSDHRFALQSALGWEIRPASAATDLAARFGRSPRRVIGRIAEKLFAAARPYEFDAGPPPGRWRVEHQTTRRTDRLFTDILVPISGEGKSWYSLDQALEVAHREGARLHGLHVVRSGRQKESEEVAALKTEFDRRCAEAGTPGSLVVEVGKVTRKVCEYARWTDLVILNLAHPPPPRPVARLSSGLRTLIRRCPTPVLADPGTSSPLQQVLLAYDGSPKAEEALFVATYFAGQWNSQLVVVTVSESGRTTSDTPERARTYLESHGVQATFVEETGPVPNAILKTAVDHKSDVIIMGGYGFSPILEVMLGSAVDKVLRESRRPVLICR